MNSVERIGEIVERIGRATAIVEEITATEDLLDQLLFSKQTTSIAPAPDQFFRNPMDQDKVNNQVESAANRLPTNSCTSNNSEILSALIGKRIKAAREQNGITQRRLSELTGIKRPNIARLEKGTSLPNLSTLLKISSGLEITLESLITTQKTM